MDQIRIGIVGAGGMGRVHYANYQHIDGAVVTAVCDMGARAAATAKEWNVQAFADVGEMARSGLVDAVDICTPTFCHHDQVMESLVNGMPTIVEKPVALTCAHAREMFDTARANHVPLYVAQVLRFARETEHLKRIVTEGTYGKPIDAVFERLSRVPEWSAGGWMTDKARSGLVPFDLHIHDLDCIVSVFGAPKRFTADYAAGAGKAYPEDVRIRYEYDGFRVMGEAAWFNGPMPFTARWRVAFENGILVNTGESLTGYASDGTVTKYDITDAVTVSTGINVPPTGWYYNELKHFVSCIAAGIPSDRVPEEELMKVLTILEEISRNM